MEDKLKQYEAPKIEDHGDLAELTAGKKQGGFTDADFPTNTPFNDLTFSAVPKP
jgi:hypothetical protein